jgi:hypothetical protein
VEIPVSGEASSAPALADYTSLGVYPGKIFLGLSLTTPDFFTSY